MSSMPITLKLGEIVNAKPALERLIQMRFSMTTSYKLARRLKIINETLITFDAKRSDLVKELGTPVAGSPGKFQIVRVTEDNILKARNNAEKKRQEANSAKALCEALPIKFIDSELAQLSMESSGKAADEAQESLDNLEKSLLKWNGFATRINEMMTIEETLAIDPIKLSELQPPENAICKTCGRSPNEISVDDVMLLYPLLAEEPV